MSSKPEISVVMPAYNAERFIKEAIESILNQTFKDFEFIIINDGSRDKTEDIILSFKDPRIIYIKNESNLGLSRSFNKGVAAARGRYIARMDSDDISLPHRLQTQINFMGKNPSIDILGTAIIEINSEGRKNVVHKREPTHLTTKWSSLISTPIYHPTVLAKAEAMKENHYNEELSNSEDYELWSRLLFNSKYQFANIVEPLLLYRAYPTSFTQTVNLDKRVISAHNTISNLKHYIDLTPEESRIIVLLRQERKLSVLSLIKFMLLYWRAARAFIKKETPNRREIFQIFKKLFQIKYFLLKHYIKHH